VELEVVFCAACAHRQSVAFVVQRDHVLLACLLERVREREDPHGGSAWFASGRGVLRTQVTMLASAPRQKTSQVEKRIVG
jgi:hypothetical protein